MTHDASNIGTRANFARISSRVFMQNANCIGDLIFGGVCHPFPELQLVSVESGVGWLPSYLEACDWQWANSHVNREHPEYDLLPSEYCKRQIYSCFWFEENSLERAIELYPDNIIWETDFPHPTCQHEGPKGGFSRRPGEYAEQAMGNVPEATLEKVLHSTAARLYAVQ